ncbi:nicotinate-nucleotide adenylyltransferase [Tumidithrix elongata RA019]|uniref:nicotinate-nucleotide adenylyltransferase n=1 Tax=Tumidithrix elongata BACA0141 TaxID=2716417 RepID=A0AAW9PSY2_9CYAN|nr:nicotinate-nucleotide adenylyltransferase [Tumidithrix elongata RA019]
MNIALFGTSADPPTRSHLTILKWLAQNYDLCAVWVSDNPFKLHQASLAQRIAMMDLTVRAASEYPNLQLHPEISSPRSLVTVNLAKEIWQGADFTLIVGADLVRQLPTWYHAHELLSQVKLLVMPRQGCAIAESDLEELRCMGAKAAIADLHIPNVSSTAYRNNGDRSVIIPSVAAYIHQEHLYECQEVNPATHWQTLKSESIT